MRRLHWVVAFFLTATVVRAAPGVRDPDWPCQQIKVPELSLASVWPGPPVEPRESSWKDDQQIVDLVRKITPRRETLQQADDLIHSFAKQAGEQKVLRLTQVLVGIYTVLDAERNSVVAGLDRFGVRQKELAEAIRSDNETLHSLQTNAGRTPAAMQQMLDKVTWEIEVFQDRRQAISYACEAPGIIEQRLFALARLLQQELE